MIKQKHTAQNSTSFNTCDADFIQRSHGLVGGVTRNVVTKANGGEGDEAVVEGVQEVPAWLQLGKNEGWHRHKKAKGDAADDGEVEDTDVEGLLMEGC